jgi:hypothetical protein
MEEVITVLLIEILCLLSGVILKLCSVSIATSFFIFRMLIRNADHTSMKLIAARPCHCDSLKISRMSTPRLFVADVSELTEERLALAFHLSSFIQSSSATRQHQYANERQDKNESTYFDT